MNNCMQCCWSLQEVLSLGGSTAVATVSLSKGKQEICPWIEILSVLATLPPGVTLHIYSAALRSEQPRSSSPKCWRRPEVTSFDSLGPAGRISALRSGVRVAHLPGGRKERRDLLVLQVKARLPQPFGGLDGRPQPDASA